MTVDMAITFAILAAAIVMFVTEVVRIDLAALIVLLMLVFTGLVQPEQAISGFSNPAVVTVWAMFILSSGLARTGVSSQIGAQMLRFARKGEGRLIAVLMSVTALLSAVMNNIGVAAMFLPITLEIARRTQRPPSRLLMPMAYGSLLGGLILLIGTASNLVIRDAMREAGYTPLGIFDFAPIGLVILVISVAYMALLGRRFLPVRQTPRPLSAADETQDSAAQYGLEERLAMLLLPDDSPLAGKSLVESRIGRALGLNILSIQRKNGHRVPAGPEAVLEAGDRLLVLGRLERIDEISQRPLFSLKNDLPTLEQLLSRKAGLAELEVTDESPFVGKTLVETDFRHVHNVNILAIRQGEVIRRTNLQEVSLRVGDLLLIHGPLERLETLSSQPGFRRLSLEAATEYHLEERLLSIHIPPDSPLVGSTLAKARLGAAYGLVVLSVARDGEDWRTPQPETRLMADDLLVVGGRPLDIEVLRGLQGLKVERRADLALTELGDGPLQIVEVMLSPYTSLAGKTLRELHFREKFGVSVMAVWRGERAYRSGLSDLPLQYGDALLCYGEIERFKTLARERDFVVLKMDVQEKPRLNKAPISALIMLAVISSAILFGMPISIAAIAGCVLMVVSGALTMEEAYQGIDWRAIFLIAAMLPLGIAMQESGAAALLGNLVVATLGVYGPSAILGGLMILSMVATQFMPSPVVAVIMSPIALTAAVNLGAAPNAFMLGIAYALAASFLSPVAHPANVLVMSPGGYRFSDYIKHGLPISLIVLAVSILLLPLLFPYF